MNGANLCGGSSRLMTNSSPAGATEGRPYRFIIVTDYEVD